MARPEALQITSMLKMFRVLATVAIFASCEALCLGSSIHSSAPKAFRLRGGAPGMTAIGIVVDIDVHPDRVDEFLKVAEADAVGSRKEPGCLRFDVLRASDSETRFLFYEAYTSADAVAEHKAQPHFKLWTDFKESGGCKSVSTKASFPGEWAFPM